MAAENVMHLCAEAEDGGNLLSAAAFKLIDDGVSKEAAFASFEEAWNIVERARAEALLRINPQ